MKKIFALAIAAMMSLGASAQLISSNTMTYHKEKSRNYDRIGVSYNSVKPDFDEASACSGVALSWTKGIGVSSSIPLYVETGVGASYIFDDLNALTLTVPLNVTYKFPVTESINIAPLAGLAFNGNITADNDEDLKHFSMDWQVGANFEFSKFYVGVSYRGGLMDYFDGCKVNTFAATLGIVF